MKAEKERSEHDQRGKSWRDSNEYSDNNEQFSREKLILEQQRAAKRKGQKLFCIVCITILGLIYCNASIKKVAKHQNENIIREIVPSQVKVPQKVNASPRRRRLNDEPSKYGKFTGIDKDGGCIVNFRRSGEKTINLNALEKNDFNFSCPDYVNDNTIMPIAYFAGMEMPVLASDGQEFHLFENRVYHSQPDITVNKYLVVVIDKNKIWSKTFSSTCGGDDACFDEANTGNVNYINGYSTLKFIIPAQKNHMAKQYILSMSMLKEATITSVVK